jgi:CTP:molybdopterin cytidylyltransferase MocA
LLWIFNLNIRAPRAAIRAAAREQLYSGTSMISAILLAAGESKRMGAFKQLLPFEGKPFVLCAIDNLISSGADEIIVVTGHRESDIRATLRGRAVRFAHNADYKSGMSASIKRGVEEISKQSEAILIALADQPQIGATLIRRLIEVWKKDRPLILVPTFNGRNGHPVIFDISLKDEILSIDPGEGLRRVLHAHKDEILRVEATDEVLVDFDLPEDYSRLRRQ